VNGQALCTLSRAEDTALYACLHGTQHCWANLSYLADFTAAMRAFTADGWDELCDAAREQGLYRALLVAMALSHNHLALELPEAIIAVMQKERFLHRVVRLIDGNRERLMKTGPDVFDYALLVLRLADKKRWQGFTVLLTSMWTPTLVDCQWLPLPQGWRWLYRVLRPLRLMGRGLSTILSHRAG
jgi:hypothetical protein